MADDTKQTTDTGDNTTGDPIASLQAVISGIKDNANAILRIGALQKELEELAEKHWDEELEELKEKYPNLERWQLVLVKKSPEFATEFLPRYQKMSKEWGRKVEEYSKHLADIADAITKTSDGKA